MERSGVRLNLTAIRARLSAYVALKEDLDPLIRCLTLCFPTTPEGALTTEGMLDVTAAESLRASTESPEARQFLDDSMRLAALLFASGLWEREGTRIQWARRELGLTWNVSSHFAPVGEAAEPIDA